MRQEKRGRILIKYIRQYRLSAFVFLLFAGIYAGIFSLYDLEVEAVFYGALLCGLSGILILGFHFYGFWKDHREREGLLLGIEFQYEELPRAKTLSEEDYQQMIRVLGRTSSEHLTDWERERQDSLDYYTTWVHQIKTPIAVMKMSLQGEDTEEHRELLAELFRIEQYVEMVLSYIRLGSTGNDFVIREYDLDGIIRQAVHKYASQFVRRKIRLIYEPVHVKVLTDEKWLLFILEQLLSNAVKYTPSGSITIRVTEDKKLSVEDTGIGIAPEDLPRIFEKGFTGYNGRADKKATGLGLNLCKKTAEKLGIQISAESEPGKGSVFTLDLNEKRFAIE
ncbi:MAG: sensor histidine kinase [Eubacteriales bacterium]|nr:sensor histidine kinase [Eubacteriales bacterium]